jgi:putative membrane protein
VSYPNVGERSLAAWVFGLSAVVCGLVLLLILSPRLVAIEGLDISALPAFHALLNGTTAVLLGTGFLLIRAGEIQWHRRVMLTAFTLSCVFLVSYLVYHSQAPESSFGGEGWIRPVYFFVLVSHVVLAPVVLPFALYALARGLRDERARHRRVARVTLPLWLYVSVTGVIVYLMMAPYYPTS